MFWSTKLKSLKKVYQFTDAFRTHLNKAFHENSYWILNLSLELITNLFSCSTQGARNCYEQIDVLRRALKETLNYSFELFF